MATPYEIVTPKEPWRLGTPADDFFTTVVDLSAPEAYSGAGAPWSSQFGGRTAPDRLVLDLAAQDEITLIAWKFYGSDSPTQTAVGRIWGVEGVGASSELLGDYICDFEIVLGARAIGAGSALPVDKLWAAAITVTVDSSAFPGVRVAGEQGYSAVPAQAEQGAAPPELIFDGLGYKTYIIEMQMKVPVGAAVSEALDTGCVYRLV